MAPYLICIPLIIIVLLPLLSKRVRWAIGDLLTSEGDREKEEKGPG